MHTRPFSLSCVIGFSRRVERARTGHITAPPPPPPLPACGLTDRLPIGEMLDRFTGIFPNAKTPYLLLIDLALGVIELPGLLAP